MEQETADVSFLHRVGHYKVYECARATMTVQTPDIDWSGHREVYTAELYFLTALEVEV